MEPSLELLFEFYQRLHRKAPGSEASTRTAIRLLTGLPPNPAVVDFGCGSGRSSLVLAQAGAQVTAVEIHEPFLDDLNRRAAESGVADRIRTVCADMADPGVEQGAFDLVWSEGAIYLMGFAEGLAAWKRWLRPGGWLAITEATWLTENPPSEAKDFWDASYPAMTTIDRNEAMLREAGFHPTEYFVLPPEDWKDFFVPMEREIRVFRQEKAGMADAEAFCDTTQHEIDIWRNYGESFGYVFYLAKLQSR